MAEVEEKIELREKYQIRERLKRREKVNSLDLRGSPKVSSFKSSSEEKKEEKKETKAETKEENKEETQGEKKEEEWSAEAEIESFAVAFATWQIPEIKDNEENIPLHDIFMKYHKDISERVNAYSRGQVLFKIEPEDPRWERGLKEPGVRLLLVSKDRRKLQRMWIPPNARSIFMSSLAEGTSATSGRIRNSMILRQ